MNKQDIIAMAREAGLVVDANQSGFDDLERFYDIATAAAVEQERKEFAVHAIDIARKAIEEEREGCAKLADEHGTYSGEEIAKDIRSRGSAT
jgi:hypothetical protein